MNDKDKILNTLKEKGLELVSNIEEYKNRKTILKVKCLKCGKIFEKAYINIADKRTKSNCPRCGNRKTMTLEEAKDFYKEKGYEFLDEEYVNTTYLHWAKEQFKGQKLRDEIKNKYCKQNNINLLRIPYWEFDNIENILNKNLLKL